MNYILDTDAIIDYLKGVAASIACITALDSQGNRLCTTAVVLAEVCSGVPRRQRQPVETFLASLRYLPTSAVAARQAGFWRQAFSEKGASLSTTDCLIAATAKEYGAAILTGNVRDYPMQAVQVVPLPRVNTDETA